jgi:hypothetical protein
VSNKINPDDTATLLRRGMQLHQRLRHRIERQLQESGGQQQDQRERIDRHEREAGEGDAPQRRKNQRRARIGSEQPERFERDSGGERAGRIGREQHAVRDAGIPMAEIRGEAGHLRLIRVADEERCTAAKQRHDRDDRVVANISNHSQDVADAAHSDCWRCSLAAKARPVWCLPQPQRER